MQFTHRAAALPTLAARLVRCGAAVMALHAVATQLTADGGRRAIEMARHCAHAVVLLLQACQRHAVFRLELLVLLGAAVHLCTLPIGRCCTSVLNPLSILLTPQNHPH